MLKQSPSRNQRSKGFKVKHILQICLLVALCIWLLNQLKHSHDKNLAISNSTIKISEKAQSQLEILSLGRKGLRPQGDEADLEEEADEIKSGNAEDEGRGGGDDEIDGHDQDRVEEEESEEVEDLIDVDDRDSIEEIQDLKGNQIEDQSSLSNGAKSKLGSNYRETSEEHYKNDDVSSSLFHKIRTISTDFKIGAVRRY